MPHNRGMQMPIAMALPLLAVVASSPLNDYASLALALTPETIAIGRARWPLLSHAGYWATCPTESIFTHGRLSRYWSQLADGH